MQLAVLERTFVSVTLGGHADTLSVVQIVLEFAAGGCRRLRQRIRRVRPSCRCASRRYTGHRSPRRIHRARASCRPKLCKCRFALPAYCRRNSARPACLGQPLCRRRNRRSMSLCRWFAGLRSRQCNAACFQAVASVRVPPGHRWQSIPTPASPPLMRPSVFSLPYLK